MTATDISRTGAQNISSDLVPSLAAVVPSAALLASSTLRGRAASLSGRIEDQTPNLGTARDSRAMSAPKFDGVNDVASLTTATFEANETWTLAWWAKRDQLNSLNIVLGAGVSGYKIGYSSSTTNETFIRVYSGASAIVMTLPVDTTDWHQMTLRKDTNDDVWLTCSGIPLGIIDNTVGQVTAIARIGNDEGGGVNGMKGSLYDVRGIRQDVGETGAKLLFTHPGTAHSNLPHAFWFKGDDEAGDYLKDSSGNGLNASLSGHSDSIWNADAPFSFPNKVGGSDIQNLLAGSILLGNNAYWNRLAQGIPPTIQYTMENGVELYNNTPDTGGSYSGLGRAFYFDNTKTYSISFFAKPDTYGRFSLGDGSTGQIAGWWDLDTLTVDADGLSGYPGAYRIEETDEAGVYRCIAEGVQVGTTGNKTIYLSSMDGSDLPTIYGNNNIGDGTSSGWIGGVQITETETVTDYAHSGLIAREGYTPRDESNKAYDVFGTILPDTGEAAKPMQLVDANCFTFDGVDSYVGTASKVTTGTLTELSVFAVLKTSAATGGIVTEYNSSGNNRGWALTMGSGNRIQVTLSESGLYSGTEAKAYVGEQDIDDGLFHEVGFTFGGGILKLFVDGLEVSTIKTFDHPMTSIYDATANLLIGAQNAGTAGFLAGSVADVRVYERELSAAEVLAHANTKEVDNTNLVGWFACSEDAGNIAYNAIDSGNNGAINNHTALTFYGTKQDKIHFNANKGHSRRMNAICNTVGTTGTSLVSNQLTLSDVADPWGTNLARRMLPTGTTNGQYRYYTTGNNMSIGQYLVAYVKQVGDGVAFGFIFSGGSGNSSYTFGTETAFPGDHELVHDSDYGDGWRKVVWQLNLVGTSILQVFPALASSHDPVAITDGCDAVIGIVDDWKTQDIYPTTGTTIASDRIPARQDGSGLDGAGLPVMYPAYTDKLTVSESKIDMHPVDWPTRNWALPVNLLVNPWGESNSTNVPGYSDAFGNNEAIKIVVNNGISVGAGHSAKFVSKPAAVQTITTQLRFKPDGFDHVLILMMGASSGDRFQYMVDSTDLSTGSEYQTGSVTKVSITAPVQDGDWVLCEATVLTDATAGFTARVYPHNGGSGTGDGVKGIIVSDLQSYIGGPGKPYSPPGFEDETPPNDFTPTPVNSITSKNISDAGYWNNVRITPYGAEGFLETADANLSHVSLLQVAENVVSGEDWLHSVEVKGIGRNFIGMLAQSPAHGCIFDLTTGEITSEILTYPKLAWVDLLDDGWARVNMVVTQAASTTQFQIYGVDDTGLDYTYTGDITKGYELRNKRLEPYFGTNPQFWRLYTEDGTVKAMDRLVDYKQPLIGTRLSQVQKFTQPA